MVELNQEQIQVLVDAVAQKLAGGLPSNRAFTGGSVLKTGSRHDAVALPKGAEHLCPDLDTAVSVAKQAQARLVSLPMETRKEIIAKVREALRRHVDELSRLAVEETGLGRYEDKVSKNLLVINKTPGPEYLESTAFTGDDGLALIEVHQRRRGDRRRKADVPLARVRVGPPDRLQVHQDVSEVRVLRLDRLSDHAVPRVSLYSALDQFRRDRNPHVCHRCTSGTDCIGSTHRTRSIGGTVRHRLGRLLRRRLT